MSRRKLRIEVSPKRVRGSFHGAIVVDSTSALMVWEHDYYPQYYFPQADVAARLEPAGEVDPDDGLGTATSWDIVALGGSRAEQAAWAYPDIDELAGHLRFRWDAFHTWFEEDEVVIVHPRNPYVRVDALHSSRAVRVDLGGTTIAHSTRSVMVFETGLPTRYYLPATDVRLDVLRASDTRTSCPYKGHAEYLSVEVGGRLHDDVAWYYSTPLREVAPVAGMIAFHSEACTTTVDGIRVDHRS